MPSTVPLETFVLTLLVPRGISDAEAAVILKHLRRKPFRRRLQNVITEGLRNLPVLAPITVSISPSP